MLLTYALNLCSRLLPEYFFMQNLSCYSSTKNLLMAPHHLLYMSKNVIMAFNGPSQSPGSFSGSSLLWLHDIFIPNKPNTSQRLWGTHSLSSNYSLLFYVFHSTLTDPSNPVHIPSSCEASSLIKTPKSWVHSNQ